MCTHNPESQLYPKHSQQVRGGDSASLLRSGETPAGVLRPALEPPAQERHGPVGASPEQGHKDDQMDGTPLLEGKDERVGAVQPREEKAPGRLRAAFQYLKGAYERAGEGLFTRAHSNSPRGNGFELKEGRFRLEKKEILYCEGGEALEEIVRSCGCLLPGSVQGQAGQGFEQPGLVEGVPA